jgi:integrase
MTERRSKGDDAIYFEHEGPCRDERRHRHCPGRWRGEITTGWSPGGKRIRRRVGGPTKTAVQDKLKELRKDLEAGIRRPAPTNYTVRRAAEDWLANGLTGRSVKTIKKNENVLEPILAVIGSRRLREIDAPSVDESLRHVAKSYSSAVVTMGHGALTRVIRHAMARNMVAVNVSALCDTPPGQVGRPSKSLTLQQVSALLDASAGSWIHAYIALCIGTGIRTEEIRALDWSAVDLDGDRHARPAVPPNVQVWRSVRARGELKTEKSRRTLAMPQLAVDALKDHAEREHRSQGLVFATRTGHELDAANVRREFTKVCRTAGVGTGWTPRELRHTGISLLSLGGLPVEEIARIAGHSSTRTTEVVYRRELRPVITSGAETLDRLLAQAAKSPAVISEPDPTSCHRQQHIQLSVAKSADETTDRLAFSPL